MHKSAAEPLNPTNRLASYRLPRHRGIFVNLEIRWLDASCGQGSTERYLPSPPKQRCQPERAQQQENACSRDVEWQRFITTCMRNTAKHPNAIGFGSLRCLPAFCNPPLLPLPPPPPPAVDLIKLFESCRPARQLTPASPYHQVYRRLFTSPSNQAMVLLLGNDASNLAVGITLAEIFPLEPHH